jgi:hypothetical protein
VASAVAPYNNERVVTVTITMVGPDGAVLAKDSVKTRLRRVQPNGPGCDPVCFMTVVRLTANGKLEAT